MIVELHGARFRNKGAELMLNTTVAELSHRISDVRFVMGTVGGTNNQREKLGLARILPLRPWMSTRKYEYLLMCQKFVAYLMPPKIALQRGWVPLRRVDALVDLSGFAYTDLWGSQPILSFGRLSRYYAQQHKPVIMLPQAFGPFETQQARSGFRSVMDAASLVYTRDSISTQTLLELAPDSRVVRQSSDITLFSGAATSCTPAYRSFRYCCVIPNARMLDQGKHEWGEVYFAKLRAAIDASLHKGYEVHIALHDSSDLSLGLHIQGWYPDNSKVRLCEDSDVFALRAEIAGASYVVGSRYHGLVAAFAAGVPSICMGWAHKYECLYEDFGVASFIIEPESSLGNLAMKLDQISEDRSNQELRKALRVRLRDLASRNEQMWDEVTCTLLSSVDNRKRQ